MGSSGNTGTPGRGTLAVFYAVFAVFVANILLGKARLVFGWQEVPVLNDITEFLLLLVAMVIFVVAALQREAAGAAGREPEQSNEGGRTA